MAWWLLTNPARLDQGNQAQLTAILSRCPQLNTLTGHIAAFSRLLTQRQGPARPHSSAVGIRQDYQAVANAVTRTWNSGPVEGRNTRVKLLKRQMYGRASFALLRKRILTC